jgi:hypothetical protein
MLIFTREPREGWASGNIAVLSQQGNGNEGQIYQGYDGGMAEDNIATLLQQGNNNVATIEQGVRGASSFNNEAVIEQYGNNHEAFIRQEGSDKFAEIIQTGSGNSMTIIQD